MLTATKKMNHSEYAAKTKKMSIEELSFTISDCREVLNAMPEGENAGYYADEINYCSSELSRRLEAAKHDVEGSSLSIDYVEKKFICGVLSLVKNGCPVSKAKIEIKRIMYRALEIIEL